MDVAQVDMMDHLGDLLASGDVKNIKTLMAEDSFIKLLNDRSNDLIPMISYYLNEELMLNNRYMFRYVEKILNMCAENGNPKECLMEFLAQIESLDQVKFQILLQPIQTTLLRIPERKAPLMQCVFNVIHSFINALPLPKDQNLDRTSKVLLESDDNVRRIRENYHLILNFYEPFVVGLSVKCNEDTRIVNQRLALLQAMFHLLGYPLAFTDLEHTETGPTSLGLLGLKIIKFISILQIDPVQFLSLVENYELISIEEERQFIKEFSSNEFKHSDLSLSVFFHLLFCEQSSVSVPCVYSRLYIFQNCLTLVSVLLRYKETLVLRKGLLLAKFIISMVQEGCVPFSFLAYGAHKEIIQLLSNVAIYHDLEENRKLAVELLKNHFLLFEPKAKFYILIRNSSILKHPNLFGFYTTLLTRTIQETFSNSELKPYFTSKRLSDLLNIYCSLKNGAETDLLENKDHILSALNLMIFLTKRDRSNDTGIWNSVPDIVVKFLKPVREAIDLSRAHFTEELKSLEDPGKIDKSEELEITVGNEQLGKMSVEEKKEVINSGLTVFDLIEHVLSRANECVENKPKTL